VLEPDPMVEFEPVPEPEVVDPVPDIVDESLEPDPMVPEPVVAPEPPLP